MGDTRGSRPGTTTAMCETNSFNLDIRIKGEKYLLLGVSFVFDISHWVLGSNEQTVTFTHSQQPLCGLS